MGVGVGGTGVKVGNTISVGWGTAVLVAVTDAVAVGWGWEVTAAAGARVAVVRPQAANPKISKR